MSPGRQGGERPLSAAEKSVLAVSGIATIGLCYAFSFVAIMVLAVILAFELVAWVAAARFGATAALTPLVKRHGSLLPIFVRSLRLQKETDYRLLLQANEAPRLFSAVADLARQFGLAPPQEVSIEMNSNAWVRLKGYRTGTGATILAVGYDLLAGLTEGEVLAVLAHEMGHAKFIRRGVRRLLDTGVSRVATLTSRLTSEVEAYRGEGKRFYLAELFLQPSDALTRGSARLLATYSRQDEFEADRVSAELFGPESLRSALVKLRLMEEKLYRLPWTERVAQLEAEGSFSGWLAGELTVPSTELPPETTENAHDPYSTHPSLRDRLAALPADDGRRPRATPAMALLSEPDRIAARLIEEVHRILAGFEQKDTESLARWARKNKRGVHGQLNQIPGLLLIGGAIILPIMTLAEGYLWSSALLSIVLVAAGVFVWRIGGYRDRCSLPIPRYAEIKRAWQAERPEDFAEQEEKIEAELRAMIAGHGKKTQKVAALVQEGVRALEHCEYLKAHVAGRLAIELNNKVVESALVFLTAAAGLQLWSQIDQNLEYVRQNTGLATPSTMWGAAWALFLAGDWGRAEGLLLQAVKRRPDNTTLLALLALSQAQRNKPQSAVLNARKAADLEPREEELTKLLTRLLLDGGRLKEAEASMASIEHAGGSDPEIAMLVVRMRLMQRRVDTAIEVAGLLRQKDSPPWLISLGVAFETARRDQEAAQFFNDALQTGHYPEALLGLARLAANRRQNAEARGHLLAALNLEKDVGRQGRSAVELFHAIVSQLAMLEEPRENCVAWIATFGPTAMPAALAQRSLMLYATTRYAAETHLDAILAAMLPSTAVARGSQVSWKAAPKDQQPARPVREGVQFVL